MVPEEVTLHLNLHLCVYLFCHSSVIAHLLCAGHCWKQQASPGRRRLSNGQTTLLAPPLGGQAKLGVEITVMCKGQRKVLPSHSEGISG